MSSSFLNKKDSETIEDYWVRLCENREAYGLQWQDIADRVNPLIKSNKSGDSHRKEWSNFSRGIDYQMRKNVSGETDVDAKIRELQKERYKTMDFRRLQRNDILYEARFELLHEGMINAIRELELVKPLEWRSPHQPPTSGTEAVVNWNDWHVGLETNNYWNTFDDDVLRDRVQHLVQKNIEYGLKNNVDLMHIFMNGDLIQGLIHVTARINSTMDAVSQTKYAAEILCESVTQIANSFPVVKLYFAKGNHDRAIANKKDELAKESFYEFIPWFMKERLRHVENVFFVENEIDHEIIVADVAGHKVVAVHGHRDNQANVVQNLALMLDFKPYAIYMGHIHQYGVKEVHGVYVFTSPSLSGVDTYAKEQRLTGRAGQLMSIYDETGEICTYNIKFN